MESNPQASLFNINSIEIIHARRKNGQTWHPEQRAISGGSKLIEQTFTVVRFELLMNFCKVWFPLDRRCTNCDSFVMCKTIQKISKK